MTSLSRRGWLPWASVSVLAVLCGALGYLQYRWTGQVTEAERSSLHDGLRSRLAVFSRGFNDEVSEALTSLAPSSAQIEKEGGREPAYSAQYLRWKQTHGAFFQRIALAVPADTGELRLLNLDLASAQFSAEAWPANWIPLRERLTRMATGRGGRGPDPMEANTIFELPRFDRGREQEWLVVELNTEFVRGSVLPELLKRYLGEDYDVDVVENGGDRQVIYRSSPGHSAILSTNADIAESLLEVRNGRGPGGPGPRRGPPPERGFGGGGPGRWQILVRHRAGSLEALVAQTRRRNLGISAAVLLLILVTVSMLVWLSRQAQRLGEMQIRFVAGVSHELRTPLTVIRTCAYNLRNPAFRNRPGQVERYGQLIEAESEKLEAMVDRVLRFASADAGHVLRERAPVAVKNLIEEELDAKREAIESANVVVEERIADGLPLLPGDEKALGHALQNLIDNALKYGIQSNGHGGNWMGVYANAFVDAEDKYVEIRIADRGAGIPADEQDSIFDAFYRGRRAVQDQVHGTGLGLNLVKTIVEAHGGTVRVKSAPASGTEFIVRLPAQ
jgi:signal transduction histidine kinase